MRFDDLKQYDEKKLRLLLREKQVELEQLRFGVAGGQMKQVHKVGDIRRDIAQIETALYSKTLVTSTP